MTAGQPLHILIGNNIYPPMMAGGAEVIVQNLAEGLVQEGHRVTLVSTCGPEMEPYPVEMRGGVEVIRFFPSNVFWHWTRGQKPAYQKVLWHLRDAWNTDAGRRFKTILEEKKPDVLHTHMIAGLSSILWRRAHQHHVPVVHTAHDYHLICPRAIMLSRSMKICTDPQLSCKAFRAWHLYTAQDIDVFCSPSQFLIDQHLAAGMKAKRSAVVRNGIELPKGMTKSLEDHAPRRFLFATRMTAEKGCQVLLDALKLLPPEAKFEMMVAGRGEFEAAFRHAAAADPRIRVLGFIQGEEKNNAFRLADALVLPSLWYENAPVVILEAAAYGAAVIGSDLGAIPEFISHDKTGLLFKPGDAASLAASMRRIIDDPALAPRLAGQAHAFAEQSSVQQMVRSYLEQYRQLLINNN